MRLAIAIIVPLIAACAPAPVQKSSGAEILRHGTVTRFYSQQSPDLLLDWKYAPGRDGAPQVAEVLPNGERKPAARE